MTFADTKRVDKTTIVFFPVVLSGSLGHALETEHITGWKIIQAKTAMQKLGLKKVPQTRVYEDLPYTTTCVAALESNFDENEIRHKIYELHYDPDTYEYRQQQDKIFERTAREDGFI